RGRRRPEEYAGRIRVKEAGQFSNIFADEPYVRGRCAGLREISEWGLDILDGVGQNETSPQATRSSRDDFDLRDQSFPSVRRILLRRATELPLTVSGPRLLQLAPGQLDETVT